MVLWHLEWPFPKGVIPTGRPKHAISGYSCENGSWMSSCTQKASRLCREGTSIRALSLTWGGGAYRTREAKGATIIRMFPPT